MRARGELRTLQDSTIRRRELGCRLRNAMTQSGWIAKDLARFLGQSESVVSRVLAGLRSADRLDVAVFLTACRVTGEDQEAILELCRTPSIPGTFSVEGEGRWSSLRHHAIEATRVIEFQPSLVPWSFQTPDYTCAVLEGMGVDVSANEDWTDFRAALSRRIHRETPGYIQLFLHEGALRTRVGDDTTMSDQLHRLLRISVAPSVSLRVVPASVGMYAGINGGFSLLEFDRFDPVVYREDAQSGWYVETEQAIARYRWVIRNLDRVALNEQDTRATLGSLALRLYGGPGSQPEGEPAESHSRW